MTQTIIEHIEHLEDLLLFSNALWEKIERQLKKYLRGRTPKKTRTNIKHLEAHREYIVSVLSDKSRVSHFY